MGKSKKNLQTTWEASISTVVSATASYRGGINKRRYFCCHSGGSILRSPPPHLHVKFTASVPTRLGLTEEHLAYFMETTHCIHSGMCVVSLVTSREGPIT